MAKAAQKPQELNINLIQEEEVAGTAGDIIHWILTIGRYLVILTEIIALGTFVLGIKLSADKNDLKSKVQEMQAEVDSKAKCDPQDPEKFCEDRFRIVQNKISYIKLARQNQFRQSNVMTEFLARLPVGFGLNDLTSDNKQISFTGTFPDSLKLQNLIVSFSDCKSKIINLDISELQGPTASDPSFHFKAAADLDKAAFSSSASGGGC